MSQNIHAIQTTVAIRPNQRQGKGTGFVRLINTPRPPWTEPLPIYVWVIEHPEGIIVIDTGETASHSARLFPLGILLPRT
jgi:hypothetical protein